MELALKERAEERLLQVSRRRFYLFPAKISTIMLIMREHQQKIMLIGLLSTSSRD